MERGLRPAPHALSELKSTLHSLHSAHGDQAVFKRPLQLISGDGDSIQLPRKILWLPQSLSRLYQRGILKIDHAEAPVLPAVGDISRERVSMLDTISAQLIVDLLYPDLADMVHAGATIRGHHVERRLIRLQQTRNEVAASLLQISQHAYLVFESFLRHGPAEGFVHAPIVTDAHHGSLSVFDGLHGEGWAGGGALRREKLPSA